MLRLAIHTNVEYNVEPQEPGHVFHVSDNGEAVSDDTWSMTRDGGWTSEDGSDDDDGLAMLQQRVYEIEKELDDEQ